MFGTLELYSDILELRILGLTEEEIEGYLDFFSEALGLFNITENKQ
jgi:hypothetical protein